ncbi:MAG: dihydroneopterin aldolase [Selenomonadaceae bacterium]|nr:dihydroneopterin aldolase [Selenomonadaceae bacterium]
MDEISLAGLRFYGFHGCFKEEKEKGQDFRVDLKIRLSLEDAGKKDDLKSTVNYAKLVEAAKKVVEGESKNLIEAVAEDIAKAILSEFPAVEKVGVSVHKPNAPLNCEFEDVAVKIERTR